MRIFPKKLIAFLLTLSFVFGVGGIVSVQKVSAAGQCWRIDQNAPMSTNLTESRCLAMNPPNCGQPGYRNCVVEWRAGPIVQPTQEAQNQAGAESSDDPGWWITKVIQPAAAWIVEMVLSLVSLLTGVGGLVLNGAIYHTVVNISDNYAKLPVINEAWKTIRDLGNMGFIFVLLYAAVQTILGIGKNTKELIVKVVVVAILINFSLFFTKFIIDIANVLTLAFYDALVPNAASQGLTGTGLSNAFMQHMNLQSLYYAKDTANLTIMAIITTGVMGSIMLLIAAFVFFAAGLLFIIRYVVLIVVLILSPIAFLSFVLPEMDKHRKQWSDALIGQAFFAPIYMALTWITIKILSGVTGSLGQAGSLSSIGTAGASGQAGFDNINSFQGFFPTFINFTIVIAFLIISLVIAKEWANKAPGGINKLTSWATGAAGGATLGMAGKLGRQTLGRAGQAIADSNFIRSRAPDSRTARLAQAAAMKAGASSFDFRATRAGGATVGALDAGAAGGRGGFRQDRENIVKRRMAELDRFSDVVTGTDVENEMTNRRWTSAADMATLARAGLNPAQIAAINANGASKEQMRTLNIDARQAEIMRRQVQADLDRGSQQETANRKDRFLHNLSQTSYFRHMNLYSGVGEDAEAAKRLRGKRKKKKAKEGEDEYESETEKTQEEKIADAVAKAMAATAGGTIPAPSPTGPTHTPSPNTPPGGGRAARRARRAAARATTLPPNQTAVRPGETINAVPPQTNWGDQINPNFNPPENNPPPATGSVTITP